jgi:hypothetical protein
MRNLKRKPISLCLLLAMASSAWSAELFVDQKNPKADDKNAGTETLPFKTIPAAVALAKPGDTIWVKAGNYEEPVRIASSSKEGSPITLSAWKDDRVQIGYKPRPLPVDGKWEPLANSKSWQIKLSQDVPEDMLVLLEGQHIVTFMQDGPPKDDIPDRAAYRKSDRTLFFNAGGKDPGTLGKFDYGRRPGAKTGYSFFIVESSASWWNIRKIEFSWQGCGMYFSGTNCTVEDCFFTHCYRGGISLHGRMETVRRCNFYRCGGGIGGSGPGVGHVLEDNLIVECGQRAEDDILVVDIPDAAVEGSGPTVFKANSLGMCFMYNIVADNPVGCGWYADCCGSQSSRVIGNAFWDNSVAGVYNEAGVADTIMQGNLFYRNENASSHCARWNIIDNLFFECGVTWHNMDLNTSRDSYNLLRGNAFVNPKIGYLSDYGAGWAGSAWPECFRNSIVDRNAIYAAPDAVLINDGGGGKKYKSLDDIRKEFGWEIHGKFTPYDKTRHTAQAVAKDMGGSVVTFRIPWGKHSAEARPMLSNSQIMSRWPAFPISVDPGSAPTFFWRFADGNCDPSPFWGDYASFAHHEYWQPRVSVGNIGIRRGVSWYMDGEAKYPSDLEQRTPSRKGMLDKFWMRTNYGSGNFWLVVAGVEPDKMPPQGAGYWSPCLGAVPGAKVTVSMKIRGKDLQPTEKGSPAIYIQFTNETGQHKQRRFIVGRDDAGKMHGEKYIKGSYDWTDLSETVTAPDGVVRMTLFFGITPCKGEVSFDDIDITTADGEGVIRAGEILPPRLPIQRIKETVLVDLSKVANRGLADETDNDGKGGWTDQGPNADMRDLKTGRRTIGGIAFNILPEPRSVVVLRSSNRAPGDLPEKVTIPIRAKLDTLFFLHAAAWMTSGNDEAFRYVLHYKDGKDVTLSVTGNNLADWVGPPVPLFKQEEGTFSTAAETVRNPQFGQGTIYRMEWNSPRDRRGVEIESIEFVGGGKSVPVLLGITGVMEW